MNVGNSWPKKSANSDAVHAVESKRSNRECYQEFRVYLEGRAKVCSRLKVQNTVFQPEFTSSKLTKETLKHAVKYVQN